MLFRSDVPLGSGLSSSAAIEVATALAVTSLQGVEYPGPVLARLCQRAENEFVGASCGIMDQFAVCFGRAGHALLIDCRTHEVTPLPWPTAISVVVVHTGHGPLDLNHLIKRVCAEVEARIAATPGNEGFRAYGLCYLELNAALGAQLGTDWPVAVDHGAIMETSWTLAVAPELVRMDRLPDDPDGTMLAVYGPNPRTRSSAAAGEAQTGQRQTHQRDGGRLGNTGDDAQLGSDRGGVRVGIQIGREHV